MYIYNIIILQYSSNICFRSTMISPPSRSFFFSATCTAARLRNTGCKTDPIASSGYATSRDSRGSLRTSCLANSTDSTDSTSTSPTAPRSPVKMLHSAMQIMQVPCKYDFVKKCMKVSGAAARFSLSHFLAIYLENKSKIKVVLCMNK